LSDWRNRDAAPIVKVAEVVSLDFNFLINFSLVESLHITKAKSRNKQLRYYEGNWATYEILKRFFKSKQCYKKRIASVDDNDGGDLVIHGESDQEGDIYGDGEGEGGGDGEGEGDGNGEGEGNGNGEGEQNSNGEGQGNGDGEGEGDGGEDDDNAVDSKGKGKAKEGSGYATGSKRKMPQEVGKSKKRRL